MAQVFEIKKPRPLFRRGLRKAPAAPIDDRILVREFKPESTTQGGIELAEKSKERLMAGVIIAVGDTAADYCYDRGIEIGDTVHYTRYAGVVEEWRHVVGPDNPTCQHDGAWDHIAAPSPTLDALNREESRLDRQARLDREQKWATAGGPSDNIELRECRACQTLIASERMIVMSDKDIILDCDLQERLETGAMVRYRGVDDDGRTQHYVKRMAERPDCFGSVEPRNQREAA